MNLLRKGLMATIAAMLIGSTAGEEMGTQSFIDALTPEVPHTTVDRIPGMRSLRGLEITPAKVDTAKPPSIDIRIGFTYDSAQLDTDAIVTLRRLGEALNDPHLSGYSFMIAGHTDASGTDAYNMTLSAARAASVVNYLVHSMNVDGTRLTARGYGESQLYDPVNPEDGINRRVQIVNLGAKQ